MSVTSGVPPAIVLIVDDEPLIRMLAVDIAEDAGYACLEAGTADEAIQFLTTRADIGIVVTDIEMPGSMSGLDLARTIGDEWPPIGVIVASGKRSPRNDELPVRGFFLAKPYDSKQLIHALRTFAA